MKRVLLATPLKNGADANYIRGLIRSLMAKIPDVALDFAVCDTGSVNLARNEIAFEAEHGGFDRLVQVDEDMLYHDGHLARILSHDVDLVAGVYCKRKPGQPVWLFAPLKGAEKRPDGLIECAGVATGFHNVRVSCLTALRKKFPEREFFAQEKPGAPISTKMEWFPMGVMGPRTPHERMKKVRAALLDDTLPSDGARIAAARLALEEIQPPGIIRGEDYYFSQMMREAGFSIFVDLDAAIIPHLGNIGFPITPDMVGYGPGIDQKMPIAED